MKTVMCEECGFTFEDGRDPGEYNCPSCEKKRSFLKFNAFCGSKPGKLYEKKKNKKNNKKINN